MLGRRVQLFHIFGVSVGADLSWTLIVVLVTWSLAFRVLPLWAPGLEPVMSWVLAVVGSATLFGSIVLHELGHALAARRFGIQVTRITLFVFGGVAELQTQPDRPAAEALTALAGPAVSAALAGAALAAVRLGGDGLGTAGSGAVAALLRYLLLVNTGLALFNCLPAFPLDGGRVLRAGIWLASGDFDRASRIAARTGIGLALALMAAGILVFVRGGALFRGGAGGVQVEGLWYLLLGIFLRQAALATLRRHRRQEPDPPADPSDPADPAVSPRHNPAP